MPGVTFRGRKEAAVLQDGTISALVSGRGQGERVAVHLDGHRAFDLAAMVADRAGLRAGATLTAEQQQALLEEDAPYRARERAVRLLGLCDRSCKEIETRLRQAGFEAEVVSGTVEWLAGLGYLDDRRFARTYAGEKQRSGWGPRRIRSELAAKGVERSIVDEVVGPLEEAEAEAKTEAPTSTGGAGEAGMWALEQTVRRRFGAQFAAEPQAAERRLAGFLARRGYDWDTIGRLARTLRDEAGGEAGKSAGDEDAAEGWSGPKSPRIP